LKSIVIVAPKRRPNLLSIERNNVRATPRVATPIVSVVCFRACRASRRGEYQKCFGLKIIGPLLAANGTFFKVARLNPCRPSWEGVAKIGTLYKVAGLGVSGNAAHVAQCPATSCEPMSVFERTDIAPCPKSANRRRHTLIEMNEAANEGGLT
jgi:hypothetical protein